MTATIARQSCSTFAAKFLVAILAHDKVAPLLSDDHFSVAGTPVETWAAFKSFRPKVPWNGAPPPDDPPSLQGGTADPNEGPSSTDITDDIEKKDAWMQPAGTETRTKNERIGRNTAC